MREREREEGRLKEERLRKTQRDDKERLRHK